MIRSMNNLRSTAAEATAEVATAAVAAAVNTKHRMTCSRALVITTNKNTFLPSHSQYTSRHRYNTRIWNSPFSSFFNTQDTHTHMMMCGNVHNSNFQQIKMSSCYFSTLQTNQSNDSNYDSYYDSDDSDASYNSDALYQVENDSTDNDSDSDKHSSKSKSNTNTKIKKFKRKFRKNNKSRPSLPATATAINSATTTTIINQQQHLQLIKPQSHHNARIVYDSIAPHINQTFIHQLVNDITSFNTFLQQEYQSLTKTSITSTTTTSSSTKRLKKKKKRKSNEQKSIVMEYNTTIGIIDAFIKLQQEQQQKMENKKQQQKKKKKKQMNNITSSSSWNQHTWIKLLLAQFLSNDVTTCTNTTKNNNNNFLMTQMDISSLCDNDPHFTPNQNKINLNQTIQTLMTLREISVHEPFYWSKGQRKIHGRKKLKHQPKQHQQHQQKQQPKQQEDEEEIEEGQLLLQSNNNINVHVAFKEDSALVVNSNSYDHEIKIIHNEKSMDVLRKEAEELACVLAQRLPFDSYEKLMNMFKEYINEYQQSSTLPSSSSSSSSSSSLLLFDKKYKDILDDTNINKKISPTSTLSSSSTTTEKDNRKLNKVKRDQNILYNQLKENVDFHVHLIAEEIAAFLYVDLPWMKNTLLHTTTNDYNTSHTTTTAAAASGKLLSFTPTSSKTYKRYYDSRLGEAWDSWLSLRDEFVKALIESQHTYSTLYNFIQQMKEQEEEEEKEDNDEQSSQQQGQRHKNNNNLLLQKENVGNKKGIQFSDTEHNNRSAEELFEELDSMRTTINGEKVGRDWSNEPVVQGRFPKKVNLQYECHMLNDKFGPYATQESSILADLKESPVTTTNTTATTEDETIIYPEIASLLPMTNQTIFVDNLPIDIDEEELKDLYCRCGDIKSMEIFNLKPNLDPGEHGAKALKLMKKNKRMTGVKALKYSRQRTPIYAMITFEDANGFKRGTNDMLRIFGMIIRKHDAKSIPARNLHKLYIENVPNGYFAIDIEEKLNKILQPNIYLSLAVGQHVNSQPSSLTLTFPSFEVAYYAYQLLKEDFDFGSDECTMNWMRTPKNSMEYWTRQIVPDL